MRKTMNYAHEKPNSSFFSYFALSSHSLHWYPWMILVHFSHSLLQIFSICVFILYFGLSTLSTVPFFVRTHTHIYTYSHPQIYTQSHSVCIMDFKIVLFPSYKFVRLESFLHSVWLLHSHQYFSARTSPVCHRHHQSVHSTKCNELCSKFVLQTTHSIFRNFSEFDFKCVTHSLSKQTRVRTTTTHNCAMQTFQRFQNWWSDDWGAHTYIYTNKEICMRTTKMNWAQLSFAFVSNIEKNGL